jgi:cytidylate kinase
MHVVTISASYGAGGTLVGPAVAERLGVPFVDRAIPMGVADDLGVPVDHVLPRDEQVGGWLSRLLAVTAPLSAEYSVDPDHARSALLSDTQVLRCTEGAIHRAVDDGRGGVILGRAAAIVLRDHPGALHVRLDGDPDRRARQAARLLGISEPAARRTMTRDDKARAAYVRHFYAVDPASPEHYHLVLDSTRIPLGACTELIVAAAEYCART